MTEPLPPNWPHEVLLSDNDNCIFPTAISTTSNLYKTSEMDPRKEAIHKNFAKLMDELNYNESDQEYPKGGKLERCHTIFTRENEASLRYRRQR